MTIYTDMGSSLLAEWAADAPGDIYEDTAGTNTAEDGDAVAAWRTTSNGSLSLLSTQSTGANCPAYRSDYASSGYPAVEFDGSNDGLVIPHDAAFNVSQLTVYAVAKADTLSAWRMLWSRVNNGSWTTGPHIAAYSASNVNFLVDNAGGAIITPGTSNRFIVAARYNLQSVSILSDIGQLAGSNRTTAMGTHSVAGGIGNGGASGGNYPWDGAIFHLLICNAAHSLSVMDSVIYGLSQRWGVTYSAPPSSGGSGNVIQQFNAIGAEGVMAL